MLVTGLRTGRWARFWNRYGFILAVLTPILLWFTIFSFGPILYALYASLTNIHSLDPSMAKFVGLKNYISLLDDRRFLASMSNVFKFVLVKGILNILLSLGLALLLERLRRGRNFYLFFIFMPVVISQVAVAMLFLWLYDPRLGLINYLLSLVEIPPQSFIRSTAQAIYSVAIADVWKTYGYAAVIFLAGLLDIPQGLLRGGQSRRRHALADLLAHHPPPPEKSTRARHGPDRDRRCPALYHGTGDDRRRSGRQYAHAQHPRLQLWIGRQ